MYFDFHDDAKPPLAQIPRIAGLRNKPPSLREFWDFVEWELAPGDDDWLQTGMELGLIGDAVLIGAECSPNVPDFRLEIEDHTSTKHHLFSVGHVWDGLSDHGWLTDLARTEELKPIWDILGWQPFGSSGGFDRKSRSSSLITDFDLDCFRIDLLGQNIPWPRNKTSQFFNESHRILTAKEFLRDLFKQSSCITIARESYGCGSIQEANILFNSIVEVIFDQAPT